MDGALERLRELAATTNGASRQQLGAELYSLAHSLEDSETIVDRLGYLHLQTVAVKIGFNLGLFKLLSASKNSLEAGQIADKLGGNKALIGKTFTAYGAGLDLTMMSAFAGAERDEAQWRSLIEDAGLNLVKDYDYNPLGYERVMEVRLP
ncbi:hypothetical protein INS49_005922 [Diaporthe citri]|uniref:uncharacterized protein n=1 Tax=Diaporthe citri TaxID=83186 RepID=UPI001C7F88DB|nr:uncharacterized protein INS49_005922 [Diaporthe citri]KAG6364322.1 hypothetical protein INS49_005922 [Diaporthe citri]